MMGLIAFILTSYGASNIMVFSSLFKRWREFWLRVSPNFFGELATCMICIPFWWGVILSLLVFSPAITYLGVTSLALATFLDGCLSSGGVWLVHTIQESLEKDE
jgi:hypothetical protein